MKVVVFGGSGLIGRKVVDLLTKEGHEAVVAAPSWGINAVTGEGLEEVLKDADVIVDTMNSPSFEDQPAKNFFEVSTKNILAAAKGKNIKGYVALSVVGTEKLQISGYFQGKLEQENLIKNSGIPYTIVRATQFYEFAPYIGEVATEGNDVFLPPVEMQPVAGIDVAKIITYLAINTPYNYTFDVAGPEKIRMPDFVSKSLEAQSDSRNVIADEKALYVRTFPVDDQTLTPSTYNKVLLGTLKFDDWLATEAVV
jgi:uncharacterized protein YbjT (DUF2867 family)